MQTKQIITESSDETERIAEQLGVLLQGGECIELVADLGGGKTTFTRGLVRGTSSSDVVASPTFTISKVYSAPHFAIHHFDFYRLQEPGLMQYELADVMNDQAVVLVVEWGDVVADILPEDRLRVTIRPHSETARMLTFTFGGRYQSIMEQL